MKKLTRRQGETVALEVQKEWSSKEGAGAGKTFSSERSAQNPQTTRFMQETEGESAYYAAAHNA